LAEVPEATMLKIVQNLIRTLPASDSALLGAKISLLKKTALTTSRKPRMQMFPLGLRTHGVSRIKRPLIERKEKE
jgi:hypothetical protein